MRGQPPLGPADAFKTSVNTYAPAVALKLVRDDGRSVQVVLARAPEAGTLVTAPFLLGASVTGVDVARAWVESSTDTRKWSPVGAALQTPPYTFTIRPKDLPAGEVWLRISAEDEWENRGLSEPLHVIAPERKK